MVLDAPFSAPSLGILRAGLAGIDWRGRRGDRDPEFLGGVCSGGGPAYGRLSGFLAVAPTQPEGLTRGLARQAPDLRV